MEFLCSQGRDFHVNTGVHGELTDDDKFYFRWDKISEHFYRQDCANAASLKDAKVSLHEIT